MGNNEVNQELNNFKLKNMLIIWAGLTIFLLVTGLIVFFYALEAKAFIVLLNAINIFLFLCFTLLRKQIENIVTRFIDKSKNLSFNIKYKHEKQIGLIFICLAIIFCCYAMLLAYFDIDAYTQLIKEDGIVEYSSSLFWFFSAVIMCLHLIKQSRGITNQYEFIFSILLTMFFIVCAGEEISWGQRLFSIETPEFMKTINVQNEITLHNIGSISVFGNIFFLITLFFFLFIPFLIQKNVQLKQLLLFLHFPIANRFATYVFSISLFTWVFIGIRFGTLGFHPFSIYPEQYYTQMDDEIFELLSAYSFLSFSLLNSRKEVTIS